MRPASTTDSRTAEAIDVCRHCGEPSAGTFCCSGCETVYSILAAHGLDGFYACEVPPGVSQKGATERDRSRFAALDDPAVAARLIVFDDGARARATLSIPAVHCASCVWLLERLWRLDPGVVGTEVDLLRRSIAVDYRPAVTTLRAIAERLASLGYEPAISVEDSAAPPPASRRRLYLQLGVAGFAFGNMMLFSIPRYANAAPLDGGFQRLFDALNVLFALPVLLFSAADYFKSAWNAVRTRAMALDVPIALGLIALFTRSLFDIGTRRGEGFLDSFAGLVFFLLIARLFQQRMFERVAFDRTYRSFLPLTVRVEGHGDILALPLSDLRVGHCLVVRSQEIVPADAVLLDPAGAIDYAFITGEAAPVPVRQGETVRAGGRAAAGVMRLRVVRDVSDTDLARLWRHPIFARPKRRWLTDVNARFGAWFSVGAMAFAAAGAFAWWPDAAASASVATAVLIIGCPCALTLSAPITLGTAAVLLGRSGLYLKDPAVALDLARIDAIVFDKTGTLTTAADRPAIETHGLDDGSWWLVRALAAVSVHPTSRAIATASPTSLRATDVLEIAGQGIRGFVAGTRVLIGTAEFVEAQFGIRPAGPRDVTFVVAGDDLGWVRVDAARRSGIEAAAETLSAWYALFLLSGDHPGERTRWEGLFGARMRFRQSPDDKLAFVRATRDEGRRVLMVGDGLNDAGALAAADVGIAVCDETACMAPACDAVVDGRRLQALPAFLRYARRARAVLAICFAVSIFYNTIGLTLALTGALTPLAAAILMPVSSLTVVGISAGAMRWSARRGLPA